MTPIDYFGHWGYAFIGLGLYYLGLGDKVGWLFRLFGELVWIILGIWMGMSSIWLWGIIFLAVDIRGYFAWKKNEAAQIEAGVDFVMSDFGDDTWIDPIPLTTEEQAQVTAAIEEVNNGSKEKKKRNKNVKRKSQRAAVATERRSTSKRKVRTAGRGHRKSANGKRRR